MFQCQNCGGNLKFDIPSQELTCEYCGEHADPYTFDKKTSDAVEQRSAEEYEVTVFTCPQCGGEILSTDNAAAGFCSFCGASTILYSRISNEHRPDFIIPFQKTKDDCKQAYVDFMKKAIFAPKELRDEKHIESFRGIYMPYWAFYITQKTNLKLQGEKSHRRGDYILTDHYMLRGDLDAYYKGLSYDASSSFSDNISEAIAPYDVKGMKSFTPAFLSGFYADTADVAAEVYQSEAENVAHQQTVKTIRASKDFAQYQMPQLAKETDFGLFNTETKTVDEAMFPVWFMSYRNGNRVAYATVNGQTGKVVADLPVDLKRFFGGSLLLALPIFLLLNLFFTVVPSVLSVIAGVMAMVAILITNAEIRAIARKENYEEDKGLWYKNHSEQTKQRKEAKGKKPKKSIPIVLLIVIIYLIVSLCFSIVSSLSQSTGTGIVWAVVVVIGLIAGILGFKKIAEVPNKKGVFGLSAALVSILAGAVVAFFNPASDLFFYGVSILSMLALFITEKEIMEQYNLLATRKLPQFDKKGGDDRA